MFNAAFGAFATASEDPCRGRSPEIETLDQLTCRTMTKRVCRRASPGARPPMRRRSGSCSRSSTGSGSRPEATAIFRRPADRGRPPPVPDPDPVRRRLPRRLQVQPQAPGRLSEPVLCAELYQRPGVAETVDLEIYKRGYYAPSALRNPLGIVPKGRRSTSPSRMAANTSGRAPPEGRTSRDGHVGRGHLARSARAPKDGRFVRAETQFRNWITEDGRPGPTGESGFKAEAGRYHLYVSLACPWAHRTLIMRKLKGLRRPSGSRSCTGT